MKTILVRATIGFATLALGVSAVVVSQQRVRPGMYEVNVDGTVIATHCYSAAEVEKMNMDPKAMQAWAEKQAADKKCTSSDFKVSGNIISMTMTCAGKSITTIATYSADKFEVVTTTKSDKGTETSKVSAHRTGDCKP